MNCYDIIVKTKNTIPLSSDEISFLISEYTNGNIPDYQMSAWLMAVCFNSLTDNEILSLTLSMRDSGEILDLSSINGTTVDKHSTGGVGDKTSLIIGPATASCGLFVPKMSGRGLGHTGGTIDKLESIPGYKTDIPFNEFINIVNKTGFSIISQNDSLCPADKMIYALRNATATVDSIPLICSSIMSKKLATSADTILLDVKFGSGAFMKSKKDAQKLADLMQNIGNRAGKKCKSIVSDMNSPLGKNIGNSLEVIEALEVLKGNDKSHLYDLCLDLIANMLMISEKDSYENCYILAQNSISSGKALEVFRKTIELQGGNPKVCDDYSLLPIAKNKFDVVARHNFTVSTINSEEIGMISLMLGAGRTTKTAPIDLSAGVVINCKIGDEISAGDSIMTLFSSSISDFSALEIRGINSIK